MLVTTQLVLAALAIALAALVAAGSIRYWHVGVVAVLAGVTQAFDAPARQSFLADLVGKIDLVNAVALNSAAFNAARIVGPALGGLLIARVGVVPSFLINAVGLLNPGQTRTTNALTASRSCGYHDHRNDTNNALRGTIVIR